MIPGHFVITLMSLEGCRDCQGKGSLGLLGKWNIVCEACGGNRWTFRERAVLMKDDEE